MSDGLDGSGCHRVYQQAGPNPDLSTKNFILFGFKVNSIFSKEDNSYNNSRRVDTERLDEICRETYQCILTNFS